MSIVDKFKKYGFVDVECRHYSKKREFNAEDYVSYMQTSSGHISMKEPYKSKIFDDIRDIILGSGDKAILSDDIIMHIARKP